VSRTWKDDRYGAEFSTKGDRDRRKVLKKQMKAGRKHARDIDRQTFAEDTPASHGDRAR